MRSSPAERVDVLVVGTGAATVGGIASVVEEMTATLRELGLTVERVDTGERRRARPNVANLENAWAALGDVIRVAREVRRVRPSTVIVHTTGTPLLPALRALGLALPARALSQARVLVELHAPGLEDDLGRAKRPLRLALGAVSRVAHALVVLHDGAAVAVRALLSDASVEVLPNWIDVGDPPHAREASPHLELLFVGTVGARKGVPVLLEAMRKVRQPAHLTVVGGAGEGDLAEYRAILGNADDLVAAEAVAFTGELPAGDARAAMGSAQAFVLPSHAEGMPVALLEAMAAGLPIVVTDAGNMGAVVRDARCGLVVPAGDTAALAAAIDELAADRARAAEMGRRGRAVAEERFSRNALGPRLLALLAR